MKENIIKTKFKENGFYILKNFIPKKKINKIREKVNLIIKKDKNYLPIKNISLYSKNSRLLKGPNGKLKINLNKLETTKGLRNISKKSNSISIKDPLMSVKELNDVVFSNKLVKIASIVLGSSRIKLGYIKLGVFFSNRLPKNCINYFHTDDLSKKIKKLNEVCKFSFTLSNNSHSKNEFGILPIKKNKLEFYKQYFTESDMKKHLQKELVYPNLKLGDAVVFDPNNFYHVANKPKNNLRIIFYVEFLGPKNKNLFNNVKIERSVFKKLDQNKRKLCSHYQVIK